MCGNGYLSPWIFKAVSVYALQYTPRTVVEVHPVEVVLAEVLLAIDLLSHGAGHALQHRHGVEERLSIAVGEGSDFSPHVLDRHREVLLRFDHLCGRASNGHYRALRMRYFSRRNRTAYVRRPCQLCRCSTRTYVAGILYIRI